MSDKCLKPRGPEGPRHHDRTQADKSSRIFAGPKDRGCMTEQKQTHLRESVRIICTMGIVAAMQCHVGSGGEDREPIHVSRG